MRVDAPGPAGLVRAMEGFLDCGEGHVVHFLPSDPIVRARDDPSYREVLNRGDLNVPDGMSVAWALRLRGVRTERLAGADAMRRLATWGRDRGIRHYLYGGRPVVVEALAEWFRRAGAEVAGTEAPPFRPTSDEELRDAAERIRAAGTDLVWVGLGTPRQDVVAGRLRDLGAAPVLLCVGAAFDFVSGARRRAPRWMQAAGLEWAFRLAAEPRRLWRRYLLGGPRFVGAVTRDLLGRRR